MGSLLSLAVRLLVREVSLERGVLVPHASELAFFSVGGRRRGGPKFSGKARVAWLGALEVVARARRRRGATRAWWRQVATRRRRGARAWWCQVPARRVPARSGRHGASDGRHRRSDWTEPGPWWGRRQRRQSSAIDAGRRRRLPERRHAIGGTDDSATARRGRRRRCERVGLGGGRRATGVRRRGGDGVPSSTPYCWRIARRMDWR